jgi:hypothetical protein
MQCIDEMMVPFKGRHGAKQYMPKKPCKWGYKFWCRAGMSGYVYDFEIHGSQEAKGPPPGVNPEEFGESENRDLKIDVFFCLPQTANVKKARDHGPAVRFAVCSSRFHGRNTL